MMKSPAIAEALKPLYRLELEAQKSNEEARKAYAVSLEAHKLKQETARAKAKAALKQGGDPIEALSLEEPEAPKDRRYVANDCTYEALGEILADNPNGVLAHRDELVSLLKTLDRENTPRRVGFSSVHGMEPAGTLSTASFVAERISRRHVSACSDQRNPAGLPNMCDARFPVALLTMV
jgi:hypothetical protein